LLQSGNSNRSGHDKNPVASRGAAGPDRGKLATLLANTELERTVSDTTPSKEQRILRVLRKVLANIVKDTTPQPGMLHPLSESTRHDIRDLFGLIAEREAELADEAGRNRNEKPYYTDEPPSAKVVSLHRPKKDKKPD
jgi:hypothetical protein